MQQHNLIIMPFRSGGAGVTLLVATFLILAEKALILKNGRRMDVEGGKLSDFDSI